jgi:hypothetical protein
MTWALEEAPEVPAHLVATLIGLANHADRHGRGAYPSQATLAEYTRKTDRGIRNDLGALLEAGLIRRGDQRLVAHIAADERPVVYDLAVERRRARATVPAQREAGTGSPVPAEPAEGPEAQFRPNRPRDRKPSSGPPGEGTGSPVPEGPEAHFRLTVLEPKNLPPPTPSAPVALPPGGWEEGEVRDDDPDADRPLLEAGLARDVRLLRPDWSTRSILRALADPAVRERPFGLAAAALVVIAGDGRTELPGRLPHDGPWWATARRRVGPRTADPTGLPPPCGQCGPHRQVELPDGSMSRCPGCHPLRRPA